MIYSYYLYDEEGFKYWYGYHKSEGEHRENGPAIEMRHGSYWMKWGYIHREDGPAVTDTSLSIFDPTQPVTYRWYLNDMRLTEEEFNERMRHVGSV